MIEEADTEESVIEEEQAENALLDDDGQSDVASEGTQDWEKDYKALQAEYTRISQINAKNEGFLNAFGGEEGLRDTLNKLQNPEVPEAEDDFGLPDKATLEPEQVQAMELVEKVAEKTAFKILKAEMEKLNPTIEVLKASTAEQNQAKISSLLGEMKNKYGDDFEAMRPVMGQLVSQLSFPQGIGLSEMEQLYAAALQKSGKLEEFGAKMYEKKIAEKQRKSVDAPLTGTPGKNGRVKIETIQDAVRAAKAELGIKEI